MKVLPPKKAAPKGKATKGKATKAKAKMSTDKRGGAGGGKKAKKAASPPKKKASGEVDNDSSDEGKECDDDDESNQSVLSESNRNANAVSAPAAAKGKKKTVEEIYQKKTQLEHILLRPDTYSSAVPITDNMYVLHQPSSEDGSPSIVPRDITYTPGLYKNFDEIVVNAADNKQRDPIGMDKVEISVDAEANLITVKNNGKGIPVVMHKEHKVHVPTLIFGHLLTGSNFDDDEKKTTGGRNGYGAKLANVFSTRFEVECYDSEQNLKFHQVFRSNMSVVEKPTVKKGSSAEKKRAGGDYVKSSFSPDLQRFGMSSLDYDTVALLSKLVYDVAGALASRGGKKLVVPLNGRKLPIKNFKDYLSLIPGVEKPVAYQKDDRWEVGVAPSTDGVLRQVSISFVNSINTSKGGQHVSYLADQIGNNLVKVAKKKNKSGTVVKHAQIKNHLFIFANCLIENPAFGSQTKETLTTRPKAFGSEFKLSDAFLKNVEKSDIVNNIVSFVNFRAREALKRKGMQFLETMLNGDAKKPAETKDFLENHTDSTVPFKVIAQKEKIDAFEKFKGGLYGKLKLTTTLSTANMNLFDQEGRITKYETPEAILSAFYDLRLDYYSKRKELLVEKLGKELSMLPNKARFVEEVSAGELIVSNRKREELLRDLVHRGYDTFGKDKKKENIGRDKSRDEENEEAEKEGTSSDAELAKGYDYLLGMKIGMLTHEKAEELRRQLAEKTKALEDLQATSPTDMWLTDLDEMDKLLNERDEEMEKTEADNKRAQKKNEKRQKKITKKKATAGGKMGKKKKEEWDSDMESSSEKELGIRKTTCSMLGRSLLTVGFVLLQKR